MNKTIKNIFFGVTLSVSLATSALNTNTERFNTRENASMSASTNQNLLNSVATPSNSHGNANENGLQDVVLPSDSSPYQVAMQNQISVDNFHSINDGKFVGVDVIKAGETIKLPSHSTMAKQASINMVTQETTNINLPSIGSSAVNEENTFLQEVLNEIPVTSYMENDAEKNTALVAKGIAEEDWSNLTSEQIAEKTEQWAEDYVDGKINAVKSQALGNVNNYLNKPINDLLGRFGKAQFSLKVDEKGNFSASDFSLFSPLYDVDQNLVFSQVGVHEQGTGNEERLIGNFGLGYRYDTDDYLVGGNVFFDHDFTGHNSRVGLGAEYWRDYLKLATNIYAPVSGWRDSNVLLDFEERAAKGVDVRAQAYLPSYPQLGGSLNFEQYFGDEVAYFGLKERQKDPYALTAGIDYTPIPLITNKASYTVGKDGKDNFEYQLDLNLQLGVPIEQQLDPSRVAASRTLKGSRYDMVDRNYDIVFEYRAKVIEVEIEAVQSQIPVFTNAELKTTRISNRSNIVEHTWYRYDDITMSWNAVANASDSSVERFSEERKVEGVVKYKLFVKTETGATGVSNEVSILVKGGNGATLSATSEGSNEAYLANKSKWIDIRSSADLDILFPQKYIKLTYTTDEPTDLDPRLFTRYWDISPEVRLFRFGDDLSEVSVDSGTEIIAFLDKDLSSEAPNNKGKYSTWHFYILADFTILRDEILSKIDLEFSAKTIDENDKPIASSNLIEGRFKNSQSSEYTETIKVQMFILDLGPINNDVQMTSSFSSSNSFNNFEDVYCKNIDTNAIVSESIFEVQTINGRVDDTQPLNELSSSNSRSILTNHNYGVCIIDTTNNKVLNKDVQNSIIWRYWDPLAENDLYSVTANSMENYEKDDGIKSILNNPQNGKTARLTQYNGLEGCRARMIFKTATSNVDNNEFIWGQLGTDEIKEADQKTTRWSEQGLQLAVQFNLIDMNDGRPLDYIAEECPDYTELQQVSLDEAAIRTFFDKNKFEIIDSDKLSKTDDGAFIGVWK